MSFFSNTNIDLTTVPHERSSRGGSSRKVFEDTARGISISWGVSRYAHGGYEVSPIEHRLVTIDFNSIQITVDEDVISEQWMRIIDERQPWQLTSAQRAEQEVIAQTPERERIDAAIAAFIVGDFALAFKLNANFFVDQIIARVVNAFGRWLSNPEVDNGGGTVATERFMAVMTIIAKLRQEDCRNARHDARLETKRELRNWLGVDTYVSSEGFNP